MAYMYTGDLKHGMKNSDPVRDLQRALNGAGYNLAVDGSFGNLTQKALNDYQQKNGLSSGIFDQQTADLLYGPNTRPENYNPLFFSGDQETWTPKPYDGSQNADYVQRQQEADAYAANKPDPYVSKYDDQINALFQQIMNRKPFEYNVQDDALYQQYAEQYQTKGKMAMQDTMGQAAALTGGYGNTYAQAVGQQQYDAYLQQLNNVIPELYNSAYQQWANDGDQLRDLYSMSVAQEARDYDRWGDNYNQWASELGRLQSAADSAYNRGYTNYKDEMGYRSDMANRYMALIGQYGYDLPADVRAYYGITDAEYEQLRNGYLASQKKGGSGTGSNNNANNSDVTTLAKADLYLNNNNTTWSKQEKEEYIYHNDYLTPTEKETLAKRYL